MNVIIQLFMMFRTHNARFTQRGRLEHVLTALRRLKYALSLMLVAILFGILGYRFIEHVSWFDAYYMSLVTLSTVGFGEVIPLSYMGRVFTSFLILFNIGFFAFAVSTVTSIFADNDIHAFFRDFRMMQRIQQLRKHTIICGFGRHAIEVCKELSRQKMPFVVVEMDQEKVEQLQRDTDYLFLQGDATLDEVLADAGVERASALVLTLPVDANNLFIVLSARQLNPEIKIISRLNSAEDELKLRRAGANHVVMPEKIGGFYMATLINKPDLVEFYSLVSNMGASQIVFEEIPVAKLKPQYREKSIAEGGLQIDTHIPIIGIKHADGHYQVNPTPDTVLQKDMQIIVIGEAEQLKRFTSVALHK